MASSPQFGQSISTPSSWVLSSMVASFLRGDKLSSTLSVQVITLAYNMVVGNLNTVQLLLLDDGDKQGAEVTLLNVGWMTELRRRTCFFDRADGFRTETEVCHEARRGQTRVLPRRINRTVE